MWPAALELERNKTNSQWTENDPVLHDVACGVGWLRFWGNKTDSQDSKGLFELACLRNWRPMCDQTQTDSLGDFSSTSARSFTMTISWLPSQAVHHCPWTPHHSCFWQGKIPSWEQVGEKYVKHVVTFLHLILLLSDQCVFQGLDLQHYDLLHLPKIWVGSWRRSTYFGIILEVARSVNIYRAILRLMERSWSTAHWIPLRSLCPGWNGSDWHLLQINANVCSELCRCLPRRDFSHVHDIQMPISHPIPPFRCVFLHSFPQQLHSASPSITTRTKTAKTAQIFVNDTIAALDRTVSITLEDPSGQAPRETSHQEVLGPYDMIWHVLCEPDALCIETSWNGRVQ